MKALDRFIQRWRIGVASKHVRPNSRILDIGCYDGRVFDFTSPAPGSVGIDFVMPETPPSRPNVTLVQGAFPQDLPSQQDRFDAITLLAVLEHIPDSEMKMFSEALADKLAPGGVLVITVPGPAVDHILALLKAIRLIDGMSLEEHHGFKTEHTPAIFGAVGLTLVAHRRFQLGLNNLFVFKKAKGS